MNDFDAVLEEMAGAPASAEAWIQVVHGDALEKMAEIEQGSVHLVATDPPYFLDGLDSGWAKGASNATKGTGAVNGLPVGMRFDPAQGRRLQAFAERFGTLALDALRPGGFAVVFSQPRLAHRMAAGLEDAGFEIRDLYAWRFTKRAQFKAFTLDHFVDRLDATDRRKRQIKRLLAGRRTPQLRPQFEAIICAQKPREGTFLENWLAYSTGLIDPAATLDGKRPATVMTVEKPSKNGMEHLTVKPVQLMEHLIKLFTLPGQLVLDPFLGSGTTAIAALKCGRACIGIEINADYIEIAASRLEPGALVAL